MRVNSAPVRAAWNCFLFLMVTGVNVAALAVGLGQIADVSATQAEQEECKKRGSSYRMTIWRARWKEDIIFRDEQGNLIRGRDIGWDEFRELLLKELPTFDDEKREVLREWLVVYNLGFRSRRAKKLFRRFFGWPPDKTFMQGATTHHFTVLWSVPASIFRLVRTAAGTWRRTFHHAVLRMHNSDDGIPRAARQHISHLLPLSIFAPTAYGKTMGMQWVNSNLINADMNLLIGQGREPSQWEMLPLCLRFRLARACVLTWSCREAPGVVPHRVRFVLSKFLGIPEAGVEALQYTDFDYKDYMP